jgi:hypothetical protein
MASLRDLAWLTIVGIIMVGFAWYAPFVGWGLQWLIGGVGVLFLILGILGLLDAVFGQHQN